jgi:hypothetical protein
MVGGFVQKSLVLAGGLAIWLSLDHRCFAQQNPAALVKELANPIASLISVPFQGNYNGNIGPLEDGDQYYVNLQPIRQCLNLRQRQGRD